MRAVMQRQIVLLCEASLAHDTLVRLLSAMRHEMPHQRVLAREEVATHLARVGLLARVRPHVLGERVGATEHPVARVTPVCLLLAVMSRVLRQVAAIRERLVARRASERPVPRVGALMRREMALSGEGGTAGGTLVGFVPRVYAGVACQVATTLECLGACVARVLLESRVRDLVTREMARTTKHFRTSRTWVGLGGVVAAHVVNKHRLISEHFRAHCTHEPGFLCYRLSFDALMFRRFSFD